MVADYILPQYHASLKQPVKYEESHIFSSICLFAIKIVYRGFEGLIGTFLGRFLSVFYVSLHYKLRVWVNVPIAIFFPTADSESLTDCLAD